MPREEWAQNAVGAFRGAPPRVGLKLKDKQELDRWRIFLTEEAYTFQHLLMVKDGGSLELGAWGWRKAGVDDEWLGCFAKEFEHSLEGNGKS